MAISTSKVDLSTIGLKVGIAFETIAGQHPTSDYYPIPKVTEIPDMDFDPDTIDVTSFENTVYKSYIDGLKDTGGVLSLTANYTEYGVDLWDAHAKKAEDSVTGLINWLCISIPRVSMQYFIPIKAIKTGLPTTPLNDKISIGYKFTVVGDIVKDTGATFSITDYTE